MPEEQQTEQDGTQDEDVVESNEVCQISKSQLKKQIRRQKWLDGRDERRRLEREKRKTKRKMLALELAESGQNEISQVYKMKTLMANSSNKFRIVIDMDFDEFMTDNEIGSSVQQVGRIYATNRHSKHPCQLYVTSLTGRIHERFKKTNTGFENWDINCSELDYRELFAQTNEDSPSSSQFIYLTGDSDSTLADVDELLKDESKIFIIGGLVDHNRHKNLCYKRALERNIPTAKLPIKEHIQLCQRHILSTVAVFEIMLHVLGAHRQWPEALRESIPKRKIAPETDVSKHEIGHELKTTEAEEVEKKL